MKLKKLEIMIETQSQMIDKKKKFSLRLYINLDITYGNRKYTTHSLLRLSLNIGYSIYFASDVNSFFNFF